MRVRMKMNNEDEEEWRIYLSQIMMMLNNEIVMASCVREEMIMIIMKNLP